MTPNEPTPEQRMEKFMHRKRMQGLLGAYFVPGDTSASYSARVRKNQDNNPQNKPQWKKQ